MAHINLLPWREELRQEQTNQYLTTAVISVLGAAAFMLMVHLTFNSNIDHQTYRNQILKDEIARLDDSLKQIAKLEQVKAELLARMEVIQSLQRRRPQIVHLFDDLVRTIPEGIYLTKIKQQENEITIEGVAESNGRVSAYMRNMDESHWLGLPKLKIIKTRKGKLRSSDFTLITAQISPNSKNDDESDTTGAAQ